MVQFQANSLTCYYGIGPPPPPHRHRHRHPHSVCILSAEPPPKSSLCFSNRYMFPSLTIPSSTATPTTRRRRRDASTLSSSSSAAATGSSPQPDEDAQRKGPNLPTLGRRFWKVAAPYWFSDDKIQARLQLASVFALTLGTTGISVGFNFLGRDFFNALANKDQEQFTKQLLYYLAAFAGGIPQLLISSRNLEFFTSGYRYLIQVLPAAVVAPMYFSGKIEFGVINQSVSAFNHILGDFSLIVYQFQAISAFSAVIDRLGEFDDVLDSISSKQLSDPSEEIHLTYCSAEISTSLQPNGSMLLNNSREMLDIENLTLRPPSSNATLVRDLSLKIYEKDHLLVTGPSGSGKTSLLRAIAGLWSTGRGKIRFYVKDTRDPQLPLSPEDPQLPLSPDVAPLEGTSAHDDTHGNFKRFGSRNSRGVFFLPQRPYMVLGTLRQQLLYPTWTEDSIFFSDNDKLPGQLPFLMPGLNSKDVCLEPPQPTTDDLLQVLEDVRLGYILSRFDGLDSTCEWSSVLSLGEQQRLAFARLLLSKPYLVLLDESTSALDEVNEAHLYKQIEAAGITYISVGHRRTLYNHHTKILHILTTDPLSTQRNWYIESINQDTGLYNLSTQ